MVTIGGIGIANEAANFATPVTRGISRAQRIVADVAEAIPPLRAQGFIQEWVSSDESRKKRIVHPPVHVDEVGGIEHLVSRVTAAGEAVDSGEVT